MARTNRKCAAWVIDLLDVQPSDKVLEGVGIQLLTSSASAGYVAGVVATQHLASRPILGSRTPD
jgi:hypothetical protein